MICICMYRITLLPEAWITLLVGGASVISEVISVSCWHDSKIATSFRRMECNPKEATTYFSIWKFRGPTTYFSIWKFWGPATYFSICKFWGPIDARGCHAAGSVPLTVALQENLHVCTRLYMKPTTGLAYSSVWQGAICNFAMPPNATSWPSYKLNVKIQVIAYFHYNIIPVSIH
jgi:hypothetical protein